MENTDTGEHRSFASILGNNNLPMAEGIKKAPVT